MGRYCFMETKELFHLMDSMRIPESRRNFHNKSELKWLVKNLHIKNFNHINFEKCIVALKNLDGV